MTVAVLRSPWEWFFPNYQGGQNTSNLVSVLPISNFSLFHRFYTPLKYSLISMRTPWLVTSVSYWMLPQLYLTHSNIYWWNSRHWVPSVRKFSLTFTKILIKFCHYSFSSNVSSLSCEMTRFRADSDESFLSDCCNISFYWDVALGTRSWWNCGKCESK